MTATIIIITIQVPFSNMSQQPVEMQKTMQKTKVRCKPRFLVMIMIVKVMVILLMLVMFKKKLQSGPHTVERKRIY